MYTGEVEQKAEGRAVLKSQGTDTVFYGPLAQLFVSANSAKVRLIVTHGLISDTAGLISSKQGPSRAHDELHRKTRGTTDQCNTKTKHRKDGCIQLNYTLLCSPG